MEEILSRHSQPPLGQLLLQKRLLAPDTLALALELQQQHGSRLGEILVGEGFLRHLPLHQTIAEQAGRPFINLLATPPAPELLHEADLTHYIQFLALPCRKESGQLVLATPHISEELKQWAQTRYGDSYVFAITSPYDIRHNIEKYFGTVLDVESRNLLWDLAPEKSARVIFTDEQQKSMMSWAGVAVVLCAFFPKPVLVVGMIISNLFYLSTMLLKLLLFMMGQAKSGYFNTGKRFTCSIPDKALPIYTLLLPLYHEEKSLPHLLAAIRALDYPKSKLDVKIILEADDTATYETAKKLAPENNIEIIRVPHSLPRTKPKACNYALKFARGEYVTIYDAEDKPDPQQLKKVLQCFRDSPREVVCVQARLNYFNRSDNLLTRLFAIEYSAWFDFMLPGLAAFNIPIPLGGTSNHIALTKLREMGEWDPYNVTEDADLGIRLALSHGRTALVDSLTMEEAPIHLLPWIKQRTRWIKGYMQTWVVHMRDPLKLMRSLSPMEFWGFQFFIGGPCLSFLLAPVMWVLSLLGVTGILGVESTPLLHSLYLLCTANIVISTTLHLYFCLAVVANNRWRDMALAGLCFPFYWVLHSVASFRALWQLIYRPHLWEKTTHGLTKTAYNGH